MREASSSTAVSVHEFNYYDQCCMGDDVLGSLTMTTSPYMNGGHNFLKGSAQEEGPEEGA